MSITIDAVYENGVLKPAQPLGLKEHEMVRIIVHSGISRARQTAGLLRWTGDVADADRFASDPELSFPPAPEEP